MQLFVQPDYYDYTDMDKASHSNYELAVGRGGVVTPATFQRVVGLVPRLHRHPHVAKYRDMRAAASDMVHSAACSSPASQSSPTGRAPPPPPPTHPRAPLVGPF